MKHVILSVLALTFATGLFAQTVSIPVQSKKTGMSIISNDGISFTAQLAIGEFNLSTAETPAGVFTVLDLPHFTKRFDDGHPSVPVFSQLIEIPTAGPATITDVTYDETEFDLSSLGFQDKIIPAQPSWSKSTNPEDIIFQYDELFYGIDAFSQNQLIHIEQGGEMRGVNMGTVVIDPISYNPVSNKIKIKYNIRFSVHFDPHGYESYTNTKKALYSPAHEGFYKQLANYTGSPTKDVITTYPIKFVIVADRMFESALQPFIQWKTEKGFTVIEAYTDQAAVGTTTTSIKNYLQGLYTAGTASDPAPTYVLLVGDVAQIPAFNGASMNSHVTDLYYACYGGSSDNIPDVYYGRFSAQTVAQLTPQINKTLMYEKYTMPSGDYLDTVLMISGVDASYAPTYGNGQINYGTTYYFNAAHGIYSNTFLYPASNGSVESTIIGIIGQGIGYGNYTAHCSSSGWSDPTISTTNIASFNNANKYGLLVGNCCQSVKFEESNCFGEALLRAENEGAVGYIGASDYSYWDGDYWWGVGNTSSILTNPTYAGSGLGAYDCAFHDNGEATTSWFISNGQMVQAGNIAVQASTYSTTYKKYYWEEYHLMGDPSVMNYFSKPDPLTISYASPAQTGNTSLVVNTEEYTYVAISLNGVLLDAQYTGTGTSVTLTFPAFTSVDTALVVATKQNKIPHIDILPIVDAGGISQPSDITGVSAPCSNSSQNYSVINVAGITYTWMFPSGWTINSGQGTNSVNVTTGNTSGTISVTPSNGSGSGTPRTLSVSIIPGPAIDLGPDTSICNNQSLILDAGNAGSTYQWSTSASTQIITIDASLLSAGSAYNYQVTVTNSNGCSATDEIQISVLDCTGIMESDIATGIFPNPAQSSITVTCADGIRRVEILDTKGSIVFSEMFSNTVANINISALSEGLYYVRVTSENGTAVSSLAIDR